MLPGVDGLPKQDAKELAKKLIKSGAISAIKPPEKEKQGFKRSKISQRKKLDQLTDKPKYQPFSAVYKPDHLLMMESGENGSTAAARNMFDAGLPTKEKEAIAREETFREKRRDGKAHYVNRDIPNVGTIYVHGIGVSEQLLKSAFAQFGNILKINCEFNKNCGFVTFESIDQANRAIDTMNGNQVQNITLKVSLARKQPFINNNKQQSGQADASDASSNQSSQSTPSQQPQAPAPNTPSPFSSTSTSSNNDWSSIAASYEQKNKPTKDKRTLIAYDDIY